MSVASSVARNSSVAVVVTCCQLVPPVTPVWLLMRLAQSVTVGDQLAVVITRRQRQVPLPDSSLKVTRVATGVPWSICSGKSVPGPLLRSAEVSVRVHDPVAVISAVGSEEAKVTAKRKYNEVRSNVRRYPMLSPASFVVLVRT
jgi:hypothetical protein